MTAISLIEENVKVEVEDEVDEEFLLLSHALKDAKHNNAQRILNPSFIDYSSTTS